MMVSGNMLRAAFVVRNVLFLLERKKGINIFHQEKMEEVNTSDI